MALHVDHPLAYDDALIASRIARRERKARRLLVAVAVALIVLIPIWLAFLLFV
jgi:hypothetical protein